jgi:hypothetical protein
MEAVDRNCEEMRWKGTGESSDVSEEAKRINSLYCTLLISSEPSAAQEKHVLPVKNIHTWYIFSMPFLVNCNDLYGKKGEEHRQKARVQYLICVQSPSPIVRWKPRGTTGDSARAYHDIVFFFSHNKIVLANLSAARTISRARLDILVDTRKAQLGVWRIKAHLIDQSKKLIYANCPLGNLRLRAWCFGVKHGDWSANNKQQKVVKTSGGNQ